MKKVIMMLMALVWSATLMAQEDITDQYLQNADLSTLGGGWSYGDNGYNYTAWNTSGDVPVVEFYHTWGAYPGYSIGSTKNFHFTQTITLPAGDYRIAVSAFYREGNGNGTNTKAYIFAGDKQQYVYGLTAAEQLDVNGSTGKYVGSSDLLRAANAFSKGDFSNAFDFSLPTEQEITLGFRGYIDTYCSWCILGPVKLYKYSLEDYLVEYRAKVAEANALSGKMGAAEAQALNDAIVSESSFSLSSEVTAAIVTLTNAINAAKASIANYATLTDVLDRASVILQNVAGVVDNDALTAYNNAVSDIQRAYNDGTVTDFAGSVATVETALVPLVRYQTADNSDYTLAIVNPHINGSDGWTCERPYGGNGPMLGGNKFEYWAGNAYSRETGSFDYHQEITGLPDGYYKVSASMFNSLNDEGGRYTVFSPTSGVYAASGSQEVVALVDEEGMALKPYTTDEILVTNGTIRIGVKNVVTPIAARWFVADEFHLTLVRSVNVDDLKPYAVLSDDNTVLTFFYDDQKASRNGMDVGPFENWYSSGWIEENSNITTVVFDDSFANCTSLTSTAYWFIDCNNLTTITGIENLKTDNVTNMSGMFSLCRNLGILDVSGFKTDNVTDMSDMFDSCQSLGNLDLSGFNTEKVTNMNGMFSACSNFTSLDLSGFKTHKVTSASSMFVGCTSLTTIYAGDGWSMESLTDGRQMFYDCPSLVGGKGTVYDENHSDAEYARIDGGDAAPGYFTAKAANTGSIPTNGLVAYYPFNGNANDESGHGNDGTPTENVTLTTGVHGEANGAYQFGGTDNPGNIHIPNSESLIINDGWSFATYIKPTSYDGMNGWGEPDRYGGHAIMGKSHDQHGFSIQYSITEETLRTKIGHWGDEWEADATVSGNYLNHWTHIAYTYNNSVFCVYINGELVCRSEKTPDFSVANTQDYYLGKYDDFWYPMNGVMDEVCIYNRALTADEVRQMAQFAEGSTNETIPTEAIDLGLPSGTKWAPWNVGAKSPEDYGGYYAWGETEEKDVYDWSDYTHCDGSQESCHNIGSDIAGTQYDVAHVKWGGSWTMPNMEQFNELLNNCSSEWTALNGVAGLMLTSNINGNSIFLPAAGYYLGGNYSWAGRVDYWSSTASSNSYMAYGFNSESYSTYWIEDLRIDCQNVRPVLASSGGTDAEPYAVLSNDNTVLTFYYDDQKESRNGMDVGPFDDYNLSSWFYQETTNSIVTVVFDDSFANCTTLTSTAWWFYGCWNLSTIIGIENLKTDNVTDMSYMFYNCYGLSTIDVSGFITDNVTDMNMMFGWCTGLTSLDVSGFNTENVTNMCCMFYYCCSLKSLDVSAFKTDNVTDMNGMFSGCTDLASLNVSSFKTEKVKDMRYMFSYCYGLTTIYAGDGWSTESVTGGDGMFTDCSNLVGGMGTVFDENHTDHTYARIDGGEAAPGYFTAKGANTSSIPTDGLVAYYPFNGNANDESGHGYHATPCNNYQFEDGIVGSCITVEGQGYMESSGGHVLLPQLDFDASSGVTLSLWVKAMGTIDSEAEVYIGFGDHTAHDQLYIYQDPNSSLVSFEYHESRIEVPYLENYTGKWVMYTLTCGADGKLKAYVNGAIAGEEDVDYDGQINTSYAALGRHWWYYGDATSTRFIGSFDEVCIYNRALTADEVRQMAQYAEKEGGAIPDEAIDLGLPSGTKWAPWNVGASKPEDLGGHYAWGETEEKDYYDWNTYVHCIYGDEAGDVCHFIGSNIAGTQYDVATEKWGGQWMMPTKEQYEELLNNCTSEWTTFNGIWGSKFTGPNGNSIFLPGAAFKWKDGDIDAQSENSCDYWTATFDSDNEWDAYLFDFTNSYVFIRSSVRCNGLSVRPVISETGNTNAEPYAVLSEDNTVLTFYYDGNKAERNGMDVGPFEWVWVEADGNWVINSGWYENREAITTVVFDNSFADCTSLTSTAYWFYDCSNLTSITGIENLKTDNVTNMRFMFYDCFGLLTVDVSGFKTDNVTDMSGMFWNCTSLTSLDVSGFKTDNVTNMYGMFVDCYSLTHLDVSGFKTDNVTDMSYMFHYCCGLTSLDVSGFKTNNVTYMHNMFYSCYSLTNLDVSGFKTDNVTDMNYMFNFCPSLTTIYAGDGWSTENVINGDEMFTGCTNLVGGKGTVYDENHTDHTYARIDGGEAAPGYFTAKNADTDISQLDNVIYIEQTEALVGSETTLSIKMKNTAQIRGFQFDLYLPDGVTLAKNNKGRVITSLNEGRLPEDDEHTLSVSQLEDGSYRFLCGSLYEETFTGSDGEVATVKLNIAADMENGNYPLVLRNIKMTENDITNTYMTDEVRSTLTLIDYVTGDINGDGAVDVSDYIGIANHIMGNTPAGFNEKAADVDGDGLIDVSDYIGVGNIITTGSIYGSHHQSRISRHGYIE